MVDTITTTLIGISSLIFFVVSGKFDGVGFASTPKIWSNQGNIDLHYLGITLINFTLGIFLYILAVRQLKVSGINLHAEVQILIWIFLTITSSFITTGNFAKIDIFDKTALVMVIIGLGYLVKKGFYS